MHPAVAAVGIERCVVKRLDQPYRAERGRDWIKLRHTVVVDAIVIGATRSPAALGWRESGRHGLAQRTVEIGGVDTELRQALRDEHLAGVQLGIVLVVQPGVHAVHGFTEPVEAHEPVQQAFRQVLNFVGAWVSCSVSET